MTDFDAQEKRIRQILTAGKSDVEPWKTPETVLKYLAYLKENLDFPCLLTGIEDFPWEERYVFGYGSKKEYEKLKQTNPSYTDTFELVSFEDDIDEQILVKVKRQSDKKQFVIGLDWLEAVDRKSKNYQLLDDYAVWYVNY